MSRTSGSECGGSPIRVRRTLPGAGRSLRLVRMLGARRVAAGAVRAPSDHRCGACGRAGESARPRETGARGPADGGMGRTISRTTADVLAIGLSRAILSPTLGAGPSWEPRHAVAKACVNSGRSPIGRNLRGGRTVATPRSHGKHSLTPRSPCCGPAARMPSCREHGFAGPCSSRWTTIPSRVPVRSSKAMVPRLPGRSSCTATSGRPRTAGPFPASPRILAMPQVMAAMRIRWNRALCDDLLLPLLPSALANAVGGVDEHAAWKLMDAVVQSDMVKNRLALVRRRHWLLPIVAAGGVRWKALDANSCPVLSVPRWSEAPEVVRRRFVASCDECTDDVVFIDNNAPRFADELDDWTDDRLERLLNCIRGDAFGSPQSLRWIEGFVRHVLGPEACGEDIRAAAVARWLAGQIGDGALAHTTRRSASRESRDELREAWRDLCEALPKAWLVETLVDSQPAVAELAAGDVIGEGLFPVPFGRRRGESPLASQLDQERLDRALYTLGRRLEAGDESERLRHSRLLLADVLLSRRDDRPMGEQLVGLPLLRAIRLTEDREEAWSIAELRHQLENRRVFQSGI